MTWVTIGLSAGTLFGMAIVLTSILGWANKKFYVDVDERVLAVLDALPGANCGGCGYVGCGEYAEAVVLEKEAVNLCTVGGQNCAVAVAGIMGVEVGTMLPFRPIIHCGAHYDDRLGRSAYRGEERCTAANLVTDVQGCIYGCLGFGDCARACNFDALHVVDGLATVDYEKCVGCGACAKTCPRNIITMTPFKSDRVLAVTCSNKDKGKDVMAVCKVGCIGCGACTRKSDLFTLENNLSTINYDAYTAECPLEVLEACEKCKRHRLVFVGKPSADDIEKTADKELPEVVEPEFKTTVDDMEWRG
ncbi:MAG: RnfABCDGE type electron transport complex subunit B [Deltaproteobacteria bacterium]|nr:RnfABCDGE type electron transport complex subunit B [Deltaproteobacteria bacterium]